MKLKNAKLKQQIYQIDMYVDKTDMLEMGWWKIYMQKWKEVEKEVLKDLSKNWFWMVS